MPLLEPDYRPPNSITSADQACEVISEKGLTQPTTTNPHIDIRGWRDFHDRTVATVYTDLATELAADRADQFKVLSARFDPESPYEYTDVVSISICETDLTSEEISDGRNHIQSALDLTFSALPPVTAGLLGSWIGSIEGFDKEHYQSEVLPEDHSWTGMHQPFRRNIQVTLGCWNDYDTPEPDSNRSHSCTTIHELGHSVHYIYGLQRPNDQGYHYPDSKKEEKHTGVGQQINLSPHQAEFVLESIRAYKRQHMYGEMIQYGYERTHPVELFACAFDSLVRKGNDAFRKDYPYLVPLMNYLL